MSAKKRSRTLHHDLKARQNSLQMQILTFIYDRSEVCVLVDVNLCVEGWTFDDGYLICSIHDIQGSNKVNVN